MRKKGAKCIQFFPVVVSSVKRAKMYNTIGNDGRRDVCTAVFLQLDGQRGSFYKDI